MKKLIIVFLAILSTAPAYAEGGHGGGGMGHGGGFGRGGMERGGMQRGGMERGGWGHEGWRGGWGDGWRGGWGDGWRGGWGEGWGGGWGGGWGWGNDWLFPSLVGGAVVYGLSQPQTVYMQPPPADGAAVNVAPAPVQYWYYCAAAHAYYPYVPSCPAGWQAVPATPPATLSAAPNGVPAR